MTLAVIVDTNAAETELFDLLRAGMGVHPLLKHSTIQRERLDVGDVRIVSGSATFVVERKASSQDFVAGFQDGRYHEQKSRMLHAGEDEGRINAYVVESAHTAPWSNDFVPRTGVRFSQFYAALIKCQLRDKIQVFQTANVHSTAHLLLYVAAQLSSGGLAPKPLHLEAGARRVAERKRQCSSEQLLAHMLRAVPGMSAARAARVAEHFGSMTALCAASEEEIADVRVGGRRLGRPSRGSWRA